MDEHPLIPDYRGACITNVVPRLLEPSGEAPAWMPEAVVDAESVVLLVLDGLGWSQLCDRPHVAPTLASMAGGPIHTVCPTTTATALTSICTGLPPGLHGVVGYRVAFEGDVLNVLRWSVANRDAREQLPPEKVQTHACFLGHRPAIVTRAEFRESGFTRAHLEGARFTGYRTTSTMVTEVARHVRGHEAFTYVYYDGLDKVAHEYGLGEHYDAELADIDRMVAEIRAGLPPEVTLVVTADHGQVDVGDRVIAPAPEVLSSTRMQSGEGRFRWLHARPGAGVELLEAARAHHEDVAWVVSRQQTLDEGWFGPEVDPDVAARLGDVALVARDDVAFDDPSDTGPYQLVGRHGSMTEAEVRVPLLAARGT